jgi:sulfur carrier protein ThiS
MNKAKAEFLIRGVKTTCRVNIPIWKAMKEKNISATGYLVVRSGILITDDEIIKPGDVLELIPVVSGG